MTTWVVTRHQGAIDWLHYHNIQADHWVSDLIIDVPQTGDTIIGNLPIHHVATLNQRGVRYIHLQIDTPPDLRGHELTDTEIHRLNGSLVEYRAERLATSEAMTTPFTTL